LYARYLPFVYNVSHPADITVRDERLSLSQTQAPGLGQDRVTGQKFQHGGMMLLADFPQLAVAGKHFSAAQYVNWYRSDNVSPKEGVGKHVTSTFDDGAPTWTTTQG
jgi:hypothetical protein